MDYVNFNNSSVDTYVFVCFNPLMAKTKNNLAEFLKDKRILAGLSQAEVSKKLGYSTAQFISNWERAISTPPVNMLKKIGNMYGISADELLEITLEQKIEEITKDLRRKFKSGR